MGWIAGVLAVFLFYKYVERKHKIFFFKIVGVLIGLGLLGLGAFLGYEKLSEKKPYNSGIRVTYSYHSSKLPKERRIQIANRIFEEYRADNPLTKDFTADEQAFLKNLFYDFVYFENKLHSQLVDATKEENDLGFEAVFGEDEKKKAESSKREKELASIRLEKHIADLPGFRAALVTDEDKFRYNLKMYVRQRSFESLPELKAKFDSNLIPWEKSALEELDEVKAHEAEKMRHALTKENASSEISITICNDREVPLLSYSFYVSGLERGRSSRHPLEKRDYGDSTRLEGDIIVKPKSCTTPAWPGKYQFFERYDISLVNGNWESEK